MYKNIGLKIKRIAKVGFVLGTASSLVAGIILLVPSTVTAILIIVFGPLAAFIQSCFIYGLGELIDTAVDIEKNTRITTSIKLREAKKQLTKDELNELNEYIKDIISENK